MIIEERIDVAAPPERVWAVMSDVERWPEWTSSVTSVERLDGGPFRIGSRARVRQPKLPTAVWTVTALEEGRYFEWRNASPGLTSVGSHRVDRGTAGATRVTLTLTWSGWLAPIIGLVYGNLSRRYVRTETEGLKRRSESGG